MKAPRKSSLKHDPLHVQMVGTTKTMKTKERTKRKENEQDLEYIDFKTSQRILQAVSEQQQEIENEQEENHNESNPNRQPQSKWNKKGFNIVQVGKRQNNNDEDSDELYSAELEEAAAICDETQEQYEEMSDFEEMLEIDESDYAILEKFTPKEPKKQLNLAELIMKKIEESNSNQDHQMNTQQEDLSSIQPEQIPGLNPRVIEIYSKLGTLLSRYKSGKLPKAFKIIPSLRNWDEILFITRPDQWTPHATFEATRMFVSNLTADMAQKFMSLILLDKIREDIQTTKKLNYHLYMALKKALYKPAAFFKGILLPLCESGNCTLREAAIIGSILAKVSIPMLHSAAALLKLAELDYTGANSLFIRILLDKKYALPYRVVDSLVFHFLRFKMDERDMPVLWHQSMLVFAQRYKSDLTPEQKEALLDLLKYKVHPNITPEIRREFQNSVCRGDIVDENMMMMEGAR